MQHRRIGCTGLKVSVIGLGTWQFGGEWGRSFTAEEVSAILAAARSCGINLIDTAECYGDHEAERLIGQAIRGNREHWIIATKFGHRYTGLFQRAEPRTPADILQQLDDSLKALGCECIDLYQYHSWPDSQFFDDDILSVLLKAKDAGKFKHLGNSLRSAGSPAQLASSRRRHVECVQLVYNRLDRRAETDAFPVCLEQDLGVLARVPLASGWLSGKYRLGTCFAENDTRSRQKPMTPDDPRYLQLQRVLAEVPDHLPAATWALAWCLKHPAVSVVIPGCKTVEQVLTNARAAELVDPAHPLAVRV
ncbi:MAG: aldo/keto reductase [Phycisphaerae bacterium]|nr:aldo/keto reductase [Phycisphaerae bacterium]MDW8263254.1 aldo/keto reductase [Phycisphaerales bacterium]